MTANLTPEVREALAKRANGQCECTMKCTHHSGRRCPHSLRGGWHAHRLQAGGSYTLSNLKALCVTCHRNTPSYGRG